MKLKELHSLMQDMAPFNPDRLKVQLEQYPTGPDIASRMLYTIDSMYGSFEGKVVVDLGCGTGMLSTGAALLGSPSVIGLDIDPDALEIALENRDQFEDHLPVDFVQADVLAIASADDKHEDDGGGSSEGDGGSGTSTTCGGAWSRLAPDTVVMNPPFGTRVKGADVEFLRAAARLVQARGGEVYSLHKSSTRAHLQKIALRELGCTEAEVLAELRYNLPATYKFHKEKSKDIEVDVWRFVVPPQAKVASGGVRRQQQLVKQRQRQRGGGRRRRDESEEEGDSNEDSSDDEEED